ncbi:MAG: right-handed parallel beta-helix repeat-containing protein [Candidatus Bipolaricaulia bacterium]
MTIQTPNLWLSTADGLVVIDGGGAEVVVNILADGIRFEGFEVRGQSQDGVAVALVQLEGVHGVLLEENRLVTPDQEIGLRLIDSYENQVINNVIEGEVPPIGPLLRGAHTGIYLKHSHGNTLRGNRVTQHLEAGVLLEDSERNLLEENVIAGNGVQWNNDLPEFFPIGGLHLVRSSANTVRANRIEENENRGLLLKHSSLNRVEGNTISGEGHLVGLVLQGIADPEWRQGNGTFGNLILDNVIEGNWVADLLVLNADGNVIRCNLIQLNSIGRVGLGGVGLASWPAFRRPVPWTSTQGNVIEGNTIRGNGRGVIGSSMGGGKIGSNTIRWNNIEGNELFGADYSGDLRWNWWGDPSGPYHPEKNPQGKGDKVSDGVEFVPWLESPFQCSVKLEGGRGKEGGD